MKVEKVYSLLEKLKSSTPEVNEMARRILKYIYQDIYLNCFDKEKKAAAAIVISDGAQVGSIRYNDAVRPFDEAKRNIAIFLDGDKSIIDYFSEMVNDEKKEYMDLFFNKIRTYFDIVDNHFFSEEDFKTFSFAFNIYCMLKAYHEHKDDFNTYSKILEDCSFLIDCSGFYDRHSSGFPELIERKRVIDILLSCNCYLEVKTIRELLKDNLASLFNNYISYDAKKVESDVLLINEIFYDYRDLKNKINSDKIIDLEKTINKCVFDKYEPYHFYCKSLLVGERLDYINRKLFSIFMGESYRKSAFKEISVLDYQLFEYLNETAQYKERDSFISCMNIIFDSDTYYEFNSKIYSLKDACVSFNNGEIDLALSLVNALSDEKHKKIIDGKMISFSNNTMNQVKKDEVLFRRMLTLYDELYHGTGLDTITLMRKVHENSDLVNFDHVLSLKIKKELERISALRKLEERRFEEIRQEIEDMARVQKEQEESTVDTRVSEEKQDSSDGKTFQKIKSIFGKKN